MPCLMPGWKVRRLGDGNRSFLCRAEDDRRTRIRASTEQICVTDGTIVLRAVSHR